MAYTRTDRQKCITCYATMDGVSKEKGHYYQELHSIYTYSGEIWLRFFSLPDALKYLGSGPKPNFAREQRCDHSHELLRIMFCLTFAPSSQTFRRIYRSNNYSPSSLGCYITSDGRRAIARLRICRPYNYRAGGHMRHGNSCDTI